MANTLQDRRDERRRMMLEDPAWKVIPIIAIPMIISMLIDSLYNLADTYFVSQLGTAATAAVGVNDSLTHFTRSLSMCFGVGAASYISRLMGAKREEYACRVGTTAMFTSMAVLTVFAVLCYTFLEPLVMLLGSTENSKAYSMDYARFILMSAPFTAGEVALSQMLRSEGSTKFSMIGMVSGCAINVILDPIFIYVLEMGVAGAALATSISKFISFCVLLTPFLRKKTLLELKFSYFTPKWEIYKEVAKMGIPTFLRSSLMTFSGVLINNIAGGFSDSALAAVSVSNKSTRFIGSAIMGFGQGFQPLAGYCWGAKRYKRVREAFWTCSKMGATAAMILAIGMFIAAPALVGVFAAADDTEIVAIGTLMIRSQCVTMVPHLWIMIVNGLFQALGRPLSAALLGMSRQLICLIPCLLTLPRFFGLTGLSISQAAADVLSMALVIPLLLSVLREIKKKEKEPVEAETAAG